MIPANHFLDSFILSEAEEMEEFESEDEIESESEEEIEAESEDYISDYEDYVSDYNTFDNGIIFSSNESSLGSMSMYLCNNDVTKCVKKSNAEIIKNENNLSQISDNSPIRKMKDAKTKRNTLRESESSSDNEREDNEREE